MALAKSSGPSLPPPGLIVAHQPKASTQVGRVPVKGRRRGVTTELRMPGRMDR